MSTSPPGPYGLRAPTIVDARAAVNRVCGDAAPRTWAALLRTADVDEARAGAEELERVLDLMMLVGPALKLAAHSLRVRQQTFHHLSQAFDLTRSEA